MRTTSSNNPLKAMCYFKTFFFQILVSVQQEITTVVTPLSVTIPKGRTCASVNQGILVTDEIAQVKFSLNVFPQICYRIGYVHGEK